MPAQGQQTVKLPFILSNTRNTEDTQGQRVLNGLFEAFANPLTGEKHLSLSKRPGLSVNLTTAAGGPGRGCHWWWRTGNLYSISNNKIYSGTTDLGVILTSTAGLCSFAETRPGATTQYLGVTDGQALYLIASDNSVIVENNVAITSSSVANPTTITANNHGLLSGNKIIIFNHTGSTPSLNGTIFTITKTGTNTFTIPINVTVGGTGGTIGVFPSPNVGDLQYMDGYWFTMKFDASIWNCAVDDPTNWPTLASINAQMLPGIGVGLGRQNNVLIGFTDRHTQMFYDAANPAPLSPLANIEQAMQQIGCVASGTIASNENTTYWVSNTATGGLSVYRLDGTSDLKDIATPRIRRSITKNGFQIATPGGQVKIILTSGTTWTVPSDFNSANNTIEVIGGGGGGGAGLDGTVSGGGAGGGGAYAKIVNFSPSGSTVPYVIGAAGIGTPNGSLVNGTNGGDTNFNSGSVIAQGGRGGTTATAGAAGVGGLGGSTASSVGTTKFSGGNGGTGQFGGASAGGGGGGGGAAGQTANGNNGANGATQANGAGGQGDGTAGGAGAISFGGPGGNGTEWISVGSGGGGSSGFVGGSQNGTGGLYGAGGGAGFGATPASGTTSFGGSNGSQGLIVITYTPTSPAIVSTMSSYILRMSGHIYYVVNLFNVNKTWAYDQDLNDWVEWSDNTGAAIWPVIETAQIGQLSGNPTVVGQDLITGKIWNIDNTLYQDNGVDFPVQVVFSPMDFNTRKRKFWYKFTLLGDTAPTAPAPILLSYSDDGGLNFTSATRTLDISSQVPFAISLGASFRRVWKLSMTNNNPLRLMGAELQFEVEE